ncbi:MAG: sigma 54-interacting transcriptional regulator [Myxococcales bacterium]|nr:sigma 54-interacting transcriptional regulator [Myxococcales bacterium]
MCHRGVSAGGGVPRSCQPRRYARAVESTVDVQTPVIRDDAGPRPGIIVVHAGGQPQLRAVALGAAPIELGRDPACGLAIDDASLSRRHARLGWRDGAWQVEDLGSRNGTFVDGERLAGAVARAELRVVRAGLVVLVCVADLRRYDDARVEVRDGLVIGPVFAAALREVAQAVRFGERVHLTGESGTGKEVAARAFHDAGGRPGPFVAVNCATIPAGLAERLLFGVRRGAFSGADADADGYLQAADGGTIFLDEVGDLDLGVQAKLLRVLQTAEVLPLGGTRPRPIDVRVCSATLHSLRARVASGEFRDDLYYRLGKPEVVLPPLRARPDEVPWLAAHAIAAVAAGLRPNALFVEAALTRPWPGNVRELLTEARAAARAAVIAGASLVDASHLHADAGRAIHAAADPAPAPAPPTSAAAPVELDQVAPADRAAHIEAALRREEGNVARAARALGVHRTQLRRWLARYAIDPRQFAPPGARGDD